ncbi:MAG: argininosuccinate lyase [Actinomycetota bacterium]
MSGPLWKGRFSRRPDEALMALSRSIDFDRRLWPQDLAATRAHARNLARGDLLEPEELENVLTALDEAGSLLESGDFEFHPDDEDIHSAIERFLTDRLGDSGARIHAGRSRNDLVATDLRMWVKQACRDTAANITALQSCLIGKAREYRSAVMPGYTHTQRAQPVSPAHPLLAHAFALGRDFDRFRRAYEAADVCPLGAAAFAGTSLPLDPVWTAGELRFSRAFDNAADAVSDRDFALEFLSASAIAGVHLSGLAEEIVLWTSSEFGFAQLDDAFATGSSIMPQKKNPDVAELTRAKAARLTADLVHLLGVLKGLPLAYNRDLQEDKEAVFDAADCLAAVLPALAGAVESMTFDVRRMHEAAAASAATATDLAEALVMKNVPFRRAHEAVGGLVAAVSAEGLSLAEATDDQLEQAHPQLSREMLSTIDPAASAGSRTSHGGTAPERIDDQIAALGEIDAVQRAWLESA